LKVFKLLLAIIIIIAGPLSAMAQRDSLQSQRSAITDSSGQRDAIDLVKKILLKDTATSKRKVPKKLLFAVVPGAGYTLSTGFGLAVVSNLAFYTTADHKENLSEINGILYYDTKAQKVFKSRSEIWGAQNNYKLVTDIRWERYPEDTYGIGTKTTDATLNHLDYLYVRVYGTGYRKISNGLYAGIGYNLDHYYNVTQKGNANGSTSDFTLYGFTPTSTSSGVNVSLLFDNRRNPINALGGSYASVIYRDDFTFLGSDDNWRSLQIDLRKYVRLSPTSNNVLAFWGIAQFTNGNIPYLNLPGTATDMYENAGRGYAHNRYRGRNELYFESEYRFGLSRNGLFGAVVFANAQSFSEFYTNRFEKVAPAVGGGLRVKINKHSDTNLALDYGVGTSGSHGFFVSLGEAF